MHARIPAVPHTELLSHLESRMARHDVPVDGGHVTWRRLGAGPPVVLLHGGHGSWMHWVRNLEALAAHFTVWVADLPGYGDSSRPAPPGFESLLDMTRRSLDTLLGADTPLQLVGFSFGALVAGHLAAARGAVSHLALCGPAGLGGRRRPKGELKPSREALAAGDDAALHAAMRHNLETHMLAGPADALGVQVHTQSCLRTRFHSRSISLAGALQDRLRGLPCPVLLIWGEHDVTATPVQEAAGVAAVCRDARVHVLPSVAHWVQYEAADEVNRLLLGWLQAPAA